MGKENADHLISCLKKETYKLTEDWAGDLYCGISLRWNYARRRLDISIPGYIKKQLLKYERIMRRIQHCPYSPEPKKIRHRRTVPLPTRYFAEIDRERNKTGAENCRKHFILRARAVDMTVLMVLRTIASEQTKGTERALEKAY